MSDPQVFLSHLDDDAAPAREIRVLIETALAGARVVGPEEGLAESDVVLLLCGDGAAQGAPLRDALRDAQDAGIPVVPIVHEGQTLESLPIPAPVDRGVEFHDQMFAIKLLLVVREALGGDALPARGTGQRA